MVVRAYSWMRWLGGEAAPGDPHPTSDEKEMATGLRPGTRVGPRYALINEIGRGGMGVVWRALDRLTGRVVTIKRLGRSDTGSEHLSAGEARATLAREFRLLTSLRHPNIITVLDYGFDDERRPYLVMDLQENAQTILEASAGRSLAIRVDLLVQALRALVYLHRAGIVHRDVKPGNMLVVRDQLKLLDFGLSITREQLEEGAEGWAGTPAYMAPEVLDGAAPSERSDLYAIGMVALELFCDGYPFPLEDPVKWYEEVRHTQLPRPDDDLYEPLRPILTRLLAKDPADRFEEASEVITALETALGRPIPIETVTTRESLIEAAPFVGRSSELETLRKALSGAIEGNGGTWLVGGESGVGKSRLLEELRTTALIENVFSLRGQATNRGGHPYHVWRDVLRGLLLRSEVDDSTAEVLKTIVPDLEVMLERPVRSPPTVDVDAAQARLLFAVEELLHSQPGPTLVILEDLQWAGTESLRLLAWLVRPAARLPLLVVGSFRNDEAPALTDAVPGANQIELRRLSSQEVAALGSAMMGSTARGDLMRALLERETEGIPFFVVEVVRELAEHAGSLDRISEESLRHPVLSGGIERVIRRRLARVDDDALAPLRSAAAIGREIDVDLLVALHPDLDFEAWVDSCARVAILDLRDQRWRFSHDKLRELLDADHTPETRRELHRRVAETMERLHGDDRDYLAALALHWRIAGEPVREVVYARRAGELALETGALTEAASLLERARQLMRDGNPPLPRASRGWSLPLRLDPNRWVDDEAPAFRLGCVEADLCDVHYRLGDLKRCREHGEAALRWFGLRVPRWRVSWPLAAINELGTRSLQRVAPARATPDPRSLQVAGEIARVQLRLVDVFFYSLQLGPLLWSSLRAVNHCEPVGRAPELAQGYAILGILANAVRARRIGLAWVERGVRIAEAAGHERETAWALTRAGVVHVTECDFEDAESVTERSRVIAERVGDLRLWEETRTLQALKDLFCGRFERSLERQHEVERLTHRSGNRQIECWSTMGQAVVLSRLGRDEETIPLHARTRAMIDENAMKSEAICHFGLLSLSLWRTGDREGAFEAAERALFHIRSMRPVAYWMQPALAGVVEVYCALEEEGWRPPVGTLRSRRRQALSALRRFARHAPLGRPHALLWGGLSARIDGRELRARRLWERCIRVADSLGTPYERARAHLELGRHTPRHAEERAAHLGQAIEQLERLSSPFDLARARAELGATR